MTLPFFGAELEHISGTLLSWLLHALVYGTILALVTWALLSSALRRVRPAVHAAFWMVVLLKFVLPIGPSWDYSLASLVHTVTPIVEPKSTEPRPEMVGFVTIVPIGDVATATNAGISRPETPAAAVAPRVAWTTIFGLAYFGGLVIVASVRLNGYRRFARTTRNLPPAEPDAITIVAASCRRLGINRMPRVRMSEAAVAPYVINAWNPTLVLSHRQLVDRDELEAVILHELAHLRRGDLLVRYVQWLAGTILYFWPVVAWVNRRIDLAREHACDEWALRHGRLSPTQYARCLLRATVAQSSALRNRSRLVAYAPAAMAANAKHVERRIEMIINSGSQPRQHRMIGILAGAALCGWAGFVLTGATGAAAAKNANAGDGGPCATPMMWLAAQGGVEDGGFWAVPALGPAGAWTSDGGDVQMFVASTDEGDGAEGHAITMSFVGAGPGGFAAFGEQHPSADANGDGTVGRAEHDAYLIALALRAPSGVMQQYPNADRNADGKLDASEAALLLVAPPMPAALPRIRAFRAADGASPAIPEDVLAKLPADIVEKIKSGGGAHAIAIAGSSVAADGAAPQRVRIMKKISNDNGTITEETQEGDNAPVIRVFRAGDAEAADDVPVVSQIPLVNRMFKVECDDNGGEKQVRVFAHAVGDTGDLPVTIANGTFTTDFPTPPVVWLLENIDATPSSAEVRGYVAIAEAAPLAQFLEANPKADRNHDGVLTVEKRDQYVETQQTKMRTRILEKHPEADANGDGVLTNDEMKTFFRTLHGPAGGAGQNVLMSSGAEGRRRIMIRQTDAATDSDQIEVEIITGEGEGSPK